ncbi:hypothetical protein B0H14DRAFT_1128181 [Mycena olivaceomarginata]|nr:hypothetical protein B0H14DRAFT_1128181 [Mycena olivaceomarginata]
MRSSCPASSCSCSRQPRSRRLSLSQNPRPPPSPPLRRPRLPSSTPLPLLFPTPNRLLSVGLLRLLIPISAPNPILLALYDDFVLYTKYSSTAYQPFCARPVRRVLIRAFEIGHTQGFIARDPARLEIVVVFRGTFSLKVAVTGAWFTFWFQFFPFTFSPPSPPRSFPVSLNPALAHELNK